MFHAYDQEIVTYNHIKCKSDDHNIKGYIL